MVRMNVRNLQPGRVYRSDITDVILLVLEVAMHKVHYLRFTQDLVSGSWSSSPVLGLWYQGDDYVLWRTVMDQDGLCV